MVSTECNHFLLSKETVNMDEYELSKVGETLFSEQKFEDALYCFTEAIVSMKYLSIIPKLPQIDFHKTTFQAVCNELYSRKKGQNRENITNFEANVT